MYNVMKKYLLSAAFVLAGMLAYAIDEEDFDISYGERAEFMLGEASSGWMSMHVEFPASVAMDDEAGVYLVVDQMPAFRKKDATEFAKWLFRRYENFSKTTTGVFSASFVVDTDGRVTDIKVMRALSPAATAKMVDLMRRSPRWTPGLLDGRPVKVRYLFEMSLYGRD